MGEELDALEWIWRMGENVTFIKFSVENHKDISDAEYDILKFYYRQWWLGTHPLFTDKIADCYDGTKVVISESKT